MLLIFALSLSRIWLGFCEKCYTISETNIPSSKMQLIFHFFGVKLEPPELGRLFLSPLSHLKFFRIHSFPGLDGLLE